MLYQLRQRKKGALNMERNDGIHTFSLKTRSSYSEIQNICMQNACIRGKHDRFSLNQNFCIADYKDKGVEILLHQSLVHPSWVTLIVNPSSLLAGEYQPTGLFRPTEQTMKQLKTRLRTIPDEIGLDTRLKAFRLSRCDQTRDRYYDRAAEVGFGSGYFKDRGSCRAIRPFRSQKIRNPTESGKVQISMRGRSQTRAVRFRCTTRPMS